MSTAKSTVLIIDDRPDEGSRGLADNLTLARVKSIVRHPSQVTDADLEISDLVLIDFQLGDWPSRDDSNLEVALRPPDGIALKSTLRRHADKIQKASPCAFAILTGKMQSLSSPLPPNNREHILSNVCGIEWAFAKNEKRLADRIKILAKSVTSLPTSWSQKGIDELNALLGISKSRSTWQIQMTADAMRCLPPVHDLSTWSHGLAFVRWMLQRILPYPTFLLEPIHLAARLGVNPEQFQSQLADTKSPVRKSLAGCEYKGILTGFSGPRWWRVCIEALLWEKTKGQSFDRNAVHAFLNSVADKDIDESSPANDPIVCYDQNFRPLQLLSSIDKSVRIVPDDWPAFADDAWAMIDDVNDDAVLRAVVVAEDLHKISDQ